MKQPRNVSFSFFSFFCFLSVCFFFLLAFLSDDGKWTLVIEWTGIFLELCLSTSSPAASSESWYSCNNTTVEHAACVIYDVDSEPSINWLREHGTWSIALIGFSFLLFFVISKIPSMISRIMFIWMISNSTVYTFSHRRIAKPLQPIHMQMQNDCQLLLVDRL